MKIALFAHNLHGGGGLTLGRQIVDRLTELAPEHSFVVTVPENRGYDFLRERKNVEIREFPLGSYRARYRCEKEVCAYLNSWGCDWAWWLGNLGFAFPNCRQSVYIRTAYAVDYPLANWGTSFWDWKFRLRRYVDNIMIRRTLNRCERAFVQTNTMRTRLLRSYPFLKEENVGLCAGRPLFKGACEEPSAKTLELVRNLNEKDAGKFRFLYVSMIAPHKNTTRIVEMFRKYCDELHDVVLYITASKENGAGKELWKKIEQYGLTESIRLLGVFPQKDVPPLFQNADAVFFPTLLETIGHGHNDALFFERPLIASDLDFAREICGDAALFVDPFSLESMKNGMLRIKNDGDLREELVKRGKARVENAYSTWEEILGGVLRFEGIDHERL